MSSSKSGAEKANRRPPDTDFCQQRLQTRPASFKPLHLAVAIVIIGIIFLPVGTKLLSESDNVFEAKIIYDESDSSLCAISVNNEGRKCQVQFDIDRNIDGPLFLYYELSNFYQNHRRYYQSKSIYQLQGQVLSQGDVELDCSPLYLNDTMLLNPCGLIANSFFNGIFLDETGIAVRSDVNDLYKQVEGFEYVDITSDPSLSCTDVGLPSDCNRYIDPSDGGVYLFHYPNDDTTTYLYESYPNQISPLDGVTDEHFIVWMRTSSMPTFRKLYGSIAGNFNSGDSLVFDIEANFEVDSFRAKKALLISNLGPYGGRNAVPGQVFITIGTFSLVFGMFLFYRDFKS